MTLTSSRVAVPYQSDLRALTEALQAFDPALIVAVARKGPRLLEIAGRLGLFRPSIRVDVVSDRALPFLSRARLANSKVAVVDDIVIYGSTVLDVANHPVLAQADTKVFCLAESGDTPKVRAPDYSARPLRRDETERFSASVARTFRMLNKPFDVDHPIITLPTGLKSVEDLESEIRAIGRPILRVSTPFQESQGNYAFSLNDAKEPLWFGLARNLRAGSSQGVRKIRLFWSQESGKLVIVPIWNGELGVDLLDGSEPIFAKPFSRLNDAVNEARSIFLENGLDIAYRATAMYRLVTYLLEALYGVAFVNAARGSLRLGAAIRLSEGLDPHDSELLFGHTFGEKVANALQAIETNSADMFEPFWTNRQRSFVLDAPETDDTLPSGLNASFDRHNPEDVAQVRRGLETCLSPERDVITNLSNLLRQPYVIDVRERVKRISMQGRLDFGLTSDEIRLFFSKARIDIADDVLSAALDYTIDCGSVVPKVAYIKPDRIAKVYRFGEASMSAHQFKYAVAECAEHLAKTLAANAVASPTDSARLPAFVFEKVFVFVCDSLHRTRQVEFQDLVVAVKQHIYGARLEIQRWDREPEWFMDWCQANAILLRNNTDHSVILTKESFARLYPPEKNTAPRFTVDEMTGLIDFLLDAAEHGVGPDRRLRTLLALTSCYNAGALIDSLQTELRLFFAAPRYRFERIFPLLAQLSAGSMPDQQHSAEYSLTESQRKLLTEIDVLLQRVADYFSQSALKNEVFRSLVEVVANLRSTYDSTDAKRHRGFRTPYRQYVAGLLDSNVTAEEQGRISRALSVIELAKCITSLSRTFFSENGLLRETRDPRDRHELRYYSRKYEGLVRSARLNDPLIQLSASFGDRLWSPALVTREKIVLLISELQTVFDELSAVYRYAVQIGPVELATVPEDKIVLVWDVVHYSDILLTEDRAKLTGEIERELQGYVSEVLHDGDVKTHAGDAGKVICRSEMGAYLAAVKLDEIANKRGKNIRAGIESTLGRERLIKNLATGDYEGRAIIVAARMANLFHSPESLQKEVPGHSYIFASTDVVRGIKEAAKQGVMGEVQMSHLGIQQFQGASTYPVDVWLIDRT